MHISLYTYISESIPWRFLALGTRHGYRACIPRTKVVTSLYALAFSFALHLPFSPCIHHRREPPSGHLHLLIVGIVRRSVPERLRKLVRERTQTFAYLWILGLLDFKCTNSLSTFRDFGDFSEFFSRKPPLWLYILQTSMIITSILRFGFFFKYKLKNFRSWELLYKNEINICILCLRSSWNVQVIFFY